MILPISFHLATNSLKAHRMRTILTTLGVMIGSFIISLILIVSGGLRQSVESQFSESGHEDLIVIRGQQHSTTGMETFSPLQIPSVTVLTETDFDEVAKLDNVQKIAPMMFLYGNAKNDKNVYDNVSIVATNADFPKMLNLKMTSGEWFDDESKYSQVVLGEKLAWGLLGDKEVINQKVVIKGQRFIVIGVIKNLNRPISATGVDIDKTAFISMNSGVKFTGDVKQIGQILIQADNKNDAKLIENISKTVDKNHLDTKEYSVGRSSEMSGFMNNWLETITVAALIFAGISLLVGGIGIMNIMLVSVVERIREIGIRKAVGATKRQICEQFLLEALLITLTGGFLGLLFAYGAGYLISVQFSLPVVFDYYIFVVGLGAPLAIGLVFGFSPAIRASNYDPIVALRHYH
ncbi:ABC transporter permease [Candidatus Saccharibacteria bacterium]|nr:ABC transporter permease [Candidatus Saccharibacteria bacterium]MCL1963294.1 ABC transporter permease [Candidatus Saccharibacteria bacterium]